MNIASELKGSSRRKFMASVVHALGPGGQRLAENYLGWCRSTVRKGQKELRSGIDIDDQFDKRGRKPIDEKLPNLHDDIKGIVEPTTQTDPTFRSTRIYTPLTAKEVRKRLVDSGKYKDADLPTERTIRSLLNKLGYTLRKVKKCKPQKKIRETDAIFDEVHRINAEADQDPTKLRISLDTKAVVKVGELARAGKSRQELKALDHDFNPDEKVTPFGVLLPETKETFVWMSTSKTTADFMVDRLEEIFPELKKRCPQLDTLVINADNGPESSGRRTQWLKRLIEFSDQHEVKIQLAYYPPYHSKYNPVERFWGVLENHWGGELLSSVKKVAGLARSMTYAGIKPVVRTIRKIYKPGIKLTPKQMKDYESRLERKNGLEDWFIYIEPDISLG